MAAASRTEQYLDALRKEFPRLRVVDKEHDPFSRLVAGALAVVTFGGQRSYLTHYVTTIGQAIYVPSDWSARTDDERYVVLRHEAVHLRQFRRLTFVGMALVYLVPILPIGLALGRARLEWEAYRETLRVTAEVYGLDAMRAPALEQRIVTQFTSGAYGWMWPFPTRVRRWVRSAADEIERDLGSVRPGSLM